MTATRVATGFRSFVFTDGPFNGDPTGAADSFTALQLFVNTIAASSRTRNGYVPCGTYKCAGNVQVPSHVTLFIEEGTTFKWLPGDTSSALVMFAFITANRTLTTRLVNQRLIGLGRWYIDGTDQPDSKLRNGIHVGNNEHYEITNVEGVGLPGTSSQTIFASDNQTNTGNRHGLMENIGLTGCRSVGTGPIQMTSGYDLELRNFYSDGGCPARVESDNNPPGGVVDNVHFKGVTLTNESGFANTACYALAHANTLRNISYSDVRCEAGDLIHFYYSTGTVTNTHIKHAVVRGGGKIQLSNLSGSTLTFPRCSAERVHVVSPTLEGFHTADGFTYKDCWVTDGGGVGIISGKIGGATIPTPASGSVCRIIGGGAIGCAQYGLNADGVERLELIGTELHDYPSRVSVIGGANLISNTGFETNTTGWGVANTVTIARSTTQAHSGSASLLVTATATGAVSARTLTGTSGFPVTPGNTYTASAWYRYASGTARFVATGIRWFDSSGVQTDVDLAGSTVLASTTWQQTTLARVAPVAAAYGMLIAYIFAAAVSDAVYVDDANFNDTSGGPTQMYGAYIAAATTVEKIGGDWANNGTGRFTGPGTVNEATLTTVVS